MEHIPIEFVYLSLNYFSHVLTLVRLETELKGNHEDVAGKTWKLITLTLRARYRERLALGMIKDPSEGTCTAAI